MQRVKGDKSMELLQDRPEDLTCGNFEIFTNGSGEVFLRLKNKPDVQIRISDSFNSIIVTAHSCSISPTSINGLDAFRIHRK